MYMLHFTFKWSGQVYKPPWALVTGTWPVWAFREGFLEEESYELRFVDEDELNRGRKVWEMEWTDGEKAKRDAKSTEQSLGSLRDLKWSPVWLEPREWGWANLEGGAGDGPHRVLLRIFIYIPRSMGCTWGLKQGSDMIMYAYRWELWLKCKNRLEEGTPFGLLAKLACSQPVFLLISNKCTFASQKQQQ